MKIIGIVFIILSSVILSGQVSSFYARKITYIRIILTIITDIRCRTEFAPKDIYSVFSDYTDKRFYPFSEIFSRCLYAEDGFYEVLSEGLSELPEISNECRENILSCFYSISSATREGAVNHLKLCEERLKRELSVVIAESETKGKMLGKLAVLSGVFAVVVIL